MIKQNKLLFNLSESRRYNFEVKYEIKSKLLHHELICKITLLFYFDIGISQRGKTLMPSRERGFKTFLRLERLKECIFTIEWNSTLKTVLRHFGKNDRMHMITLCSRPGSANASWADRAIRVRPRLPDNSGLGREVFAREFNYSYIYGCILFLECSEGTSSFYF